MFSIFKDALKSKPKDFAEDNLHARESTIDDVLYYLHEVLGQNELILLNLKDLSARLVVDERGGLIRPNKDHKTISKKQFLTIKRILQRNLTSDSLSNGYLSKLIRAFSNITEED